MSGLMIEYYSPAHTYHKSDTFSTGSSQDNTEKSSNLVITQFSLDAFNSKPKFSSKLSKTTKCSINNEENDQYSVQDFSESFPRFQTQTSESDINFNENIEQMKTKWTLCNKINPDSEQESTSIFGLYHMLEEYPELAILKGSKREYSLFFN